MAIRLLALHMKFCIVDAVTDSAARATAVQVLHVEGQRNAKTLYVWDGSDARPFPYRWVAAWLIGFDTKWWLFEVLLP